MAIDMSKVHTVFESTNLAAVKYAKKMFDCVCDTDIDNGTFGHMEELVSAKIYKFVPGVKAGEEVVVAHMPEWDEDETSKLNQRRNHFYIPAGMPFRVYSLTMSDKFAISIEGFTEATKTIVSDETDFLENDVFLTVGEGGKLAASKTTAVDEDSAPVMEARIEGKRLHGAKLITPLRQYGSDYAMYEARIKVLA